MPLRVQRGAEGPAAGARFWRELAPTHSGGSEALSGSPEQTNLHRPQPQRRSLHAAPRPSTANLGGTLQQQPRPTIGRKLSEQRLRRDYVSDSRNYRNNRGLAKDRAGRCRTRQDNALSTIHLSKQRIVQYAPWRSRSLCHPGDPHLPIRRERELIPATLLHRRDKRVLRQRNGRRYVRHFGDGVGNVLNSLRMADTPDRYHEHSGPP